MFLAEDEPAAGATAGGADALANGLNGFTELLLRVVLDISFFEGNEFVRDDRVVEDCLDGRGALP
jgi:hypothetical protein